MCECRPVEGVNTAPVVVDDAGGEETGLVESGVEAGGDAVGAVCSVGVRWYGGADIGPFMIRSYRTEGQRWRRVCEQMSRKGEDRRVTWWVFRHCLSGVNLVLMRSLHGRMAAGG